MDKESLLAEAQSLQPHLAALRRELHRHPETGFDLDWTLAYVRRELEAMGYAPERCGKAGLVALAGGKRPGRTILLRADMDALPLQEEADVEYASEHPGKMHGCGHDMHTAMLLGAARLLKDHEEEICGTVKLMFQPAEEIFQGALDMIGAGVLEEPKPDGAVMIHVTAGQPIPAGAYLVPSGGVSMTSCEQYHIRVYGQGGHGSTPHKAIDPVTAAAHIHLALQEIQSRELDPADYGVFTTCMFRAGEASNIIPNHADMWGTIRTADPEGRVGEQIKSRIGEIARGIGAAMRCRVEVTFAHYCPCMMVDKTLAEKVVAYLRELDGAQVLPIPERAVGSEDFSFISCKVPTVSLFLAAGDAEEGYTYGLHNPRVRFDDSVLWRGCAAYACVALNWLRE